MANIRKRNGKIDVYSSDKIVAAINKAAAEVGKVLTQEEINGIINPISELVETSDILFNVEEIQDFVEEGLIAQNHAKVAKAYILYRAEKTALRKKGWEMTDLQRDILFKKYIYENEGFNGFIERVGYNNPPIQKLMRQKKFLPAGRILMGRRLFEHNVKVTYSNCFVQDYVEDNIESIFEESIY